MEQCPVCTLYLREGMTLSDHLDTHPKDQVIKALCNLAQRPLTPATPALSLTSSGPPSPCPCPEPDSSPRHRVPRRPRQETTPNPTPLLRPQHSMFVISSSPAFPGSRMNLPPPPLKLHAPSPSPSVLSYRPFSTPSPYPYPPQSESSSSSECRPQGLKILSNVKVELPIVDQREVIDLTRDYRKKKLSCFGPSRYAVEDDCEEAILPDKLENCFSVIKSAPEQSLPPPDSVPSATPEDSADYVDESQSRPDDDDYRVKIESISEITIIDDPIKEEDGIRPNSDRPENLTTEDSERRIFADSSRSSVADSEAEIPIERLESEIENGDAKDVADAEPVRPINVIAFGNAPVSCSRSSSSAMSGFAESTVRYAESESSAPETMRDSYGEYPEFFSVKTHQRLAPESVASVPNEESRFVDEDARKRPGYVWEDPIEKEEFTFSSFAYQYPRVTECTAPVELPESENKQYAELICPSKTFEEKPTEYAQDSGGSILPDRSSPVTDTLNICTDERMPPHGELSEQESSGDIDSAWAGMYCDVGVGVSSSYNLLPRGSWHSDGSDNDAPHSPVKNDHSIDNEDMPIVTGIKPPDKNYKCATCGMSFNCPKERRVHRSKEHPIHKEAPVNADEKKSATKSKIKSQMTTLPTPAKIKHEKILDTVDKEMEAFNLQLVMQNIKSIQEPEVVKPDLLGLPPLESLDSKSNLGILGLSNIVQRRKREYSCLTCKEKFANDLLYQAHLKIHPLECLTCGKFFTRRANLKLHIKRHMGIKDYKCEICEKRFITKQKMVEHYNSHTGSAPIKCSLCDETFRRHSNMVQHRNRHHLNLKKRLRDYVCHCGEVFHSKKKLAWHKEIHEDRPKACLHCSEKFIHMASLTRHMRRAHNNFYVPDEKRTRENVQCPICNNVYLKSSIDMHLQTHTGKKPYSCVMCNKSFTTKWNLKLHRWTHANRSTKPFKCGLCKGAFIRSSDYVSHMNAHKSVKPYTCNYCGCQFIRKYNCQRHVKEHENDKKYVCQVVDCGKSFHRSYYLSEHMRVHSGARPFSCNICGKTSSTKSNHNKHIKIHLTRDPVTTEG